MKDSNTPNRAFAPKPAIHLQMELNEPHCIHLDNGIKTCFIEAGQEEVTRIDWVFDAGSAFQNKRLVATATNRLLREGTRTKSSFQISSLLDYYGAYLDTSVTKDTATLTLYTLNKHLENLLPLVGELLFEPAFPADELHTWVQKQQQEFLVNNSKVKYRAMSTFNSLVFGEKSTYGQYLKEEDFDILELSDIENFYHQLYVPENCWILVSGQISPELPNLLNKYYGSKITSKATFQLPKVCYIDETVKGGYHLEEKKEALQSAIRVGRPIISKQHPDYQILKLLNTVLGGYFGSRLMTNLREEKGFTYGISSYLVNYRNAGFMSVATEVNATHTAAALDEICFEMKRLREKLVGEEELSLVKNYLYGTFLRSFDGPFSLSNRYIAAHDNNLNFNYYHQSLKTMIQTTSEQLIEVANKYLVPEDMIKLVVGKNEKPVT